MTFDDEAGAGLPAAQGRREPGQAAAVGVQRGFRQPPHRHPRGVFGRPTCEASSRSLGFGTFQPMRMCPEDPMPIDRTFRTALMLASLALAPSVHAAESANDHDGDGFASDRDCDDANANVSPDAAETVGDGVDSDCDGAELCYVDADGDGQRAGGNAKTRSADVDCTGPGEAVADAPADDCDDEDATVHTGATEVCNGVDDDCDGNMDNDAVDAHTWYADHDEDGYTDPTRWVDACYAPLGHAAPSLTDCDDADPSVSPGSDDIPGDGVDQDCDGADAVAADTESDPIADDGAGDDGGDDDDDGASAALAADDEPESDATGCAAGGTRRDATGVLALLMAPLLRRRVKKAA